MGYFKTHVSRTDIGTRFLTVAPNIGSLNPLSDKPLYFQYLLTDSLDFEIEQFFLNNRERGISPDAFQKDTLLKNIVIFKDEIQKEQICKLLEEDLDTVRSFVRPSSDQLKYAKAKLEAELNRAQLPQFINAVEQMCTEQNTADYIKRFIQSKVSKER